MGIGYLLFFFHLQFVVVFVVVVLHDQSEGISGDAAVSCSEAVAVVLLVIGVLCCVVNAVFGRFVTKKYCVQHIN